MTKFFKMGNEFWRGKDITWYSVNKDVELGTTTIEFKSQFEFDYNFAEDMPIQTLFSFIITREELREFEEVVNV